MQLGNNKYTTEHRSDSELTTVQYQQHDLWLDLWLDLQGTDTRMTSTHTASKPLYIRGLLNWYCTWDYNMDVLNAVVFYSMLKWRHGWVIICQWSYVQSLRSILKGGWVGGWVSEWVSEWVREGGSEWGSEGVSEWVREWGSEWGSEGVRERAKQPYSDIGQNMKT